MKRSERFTKQSESTSRMNLVMKEVMLLEKARLEQARIKIRAINRLKRKFRPNIDAIRDAEKDFEAILNDIEMGSVEDETMRGILTAYYLEGKDWTDIGEMFYMHRTTVQKKVQRFFDEGE